MARLQVEPDEESLPVSDPDETETVDDAGSGVDLVAVIWVTGAFLGAAAVGGGLPDDDWGADVGSTDPAGADASGRFEAVFDPPEAAPDVVGFVSDDSGFVVSGFALSGFVLVWVGFALGASFEGDVGGNVEGKSAEEETAAIPAVAAAARVRPVRSGEVVKDSTALLTCSA